MVQTKMLSAGSKGLRMEASKRGELRGVGNVLYSYMSS